MLVHLFLRVHLATFLVMFLYYSKVTSVWPGENTFFQIKLDKTENERIAGKAVWINDTTDERILQEGWREKRNLVYCDCFTLKIHFSTWKTGVYTYNAFLLRHILKTRFCRQEILMCVCVFFFVFFFLGGGGNNSLTVMINQLIWFSLVGHFCSHSDLGIDKWYVVLK